MTRFEIDHFDKDSNARSGCLHTDHGSIDTPIFMPVGTLGTVKGVHQRELKEDIHAQIILGNTYHLYLRPGTDILYRGGGLHRFINWDRPILTDSGGYQVYSLASRRKITEEGVRFASHIDGSYHHFSPEIVMDIQRLIGADIVMAFDECTPYPCDKSYARKSMHMTHRWLDRCCTHFDASQKLYEHQQTLSPIVQGSVYPDLRKESAQYIASKERDINAIGGLSVGEPHEDMYAMTALVCDILPKEKPRYLMGVGLPENILECIALGIDMFDCVLPSRNARHGLLYTAQGVIRIKNKKWADDFEPIDPEGSSWVSKNYSKAYLRHLFHSKELLAGQIATIHNLSFYMWLVRTAKQKIKEGIFAAWKTDMVQKLKTKL